jgi:hypothetical protein
LKKVAAFVFLHTANCTNMHEKGIVQVFYIIGLNKLGFKNFNLVATNPKKLAKNRRKYEFLY